MTLPVDLSVTIRFGVGAGFGNVLVWGDETEGTWGDHSWGTSAATPVDVTSLVRGVSIRRGRDRVFDNYNNGTATVTLIDTTGDFDPSNSGGPYYGEILPMRQLRISADYEGTTYYLFSGYISTWDFAYDPGLEATLVTVTAEDGFRLLNLALVDAIAGTADQDLPGTRVEDILDTVSWPGSMRVVSDGATKLLEDPGGERSSLSALQLVESTEEGALFCDPSGNLNFKDRQDLIDQSGITAIVFDDDGTDIQYHAIDLSLDDTELANSVSVEAIGGVAQEASDSTSISAYFLRSLSRTGMLFYDDADALSQAQRLLAYKKDVGLRVDSITLDNSTDSDGVLPSLTLKLNDPIQVNKTNAGSVRLSVDLVVQGIDHDIRPDRWLTRLTTAKPPTT